jgi:hypothetical protein
MADLLATHMGLWTAAKLRRASFSVADVLFQYAGSLRPCPARFSLATSRQRHQEVRYA